MDLLAFLKSHENLGRVPENQLQWFIDHAEEHTYEMDEIIFRPDDEIVELQIVLEGVIRIYRVQNGQQRDFFRLERGSISGVLPYSRLKTTSAYSTAVEKSRVLGLHKSLFQEMIHENYELTEVFVHQMTSRVRSFTVRQQMDEKLISLGKLSAGLAHELNNPASAIVRSSQALKNHLKVLPENFKKVIKIKMGDDEVDAVNHILFSRINSKEGSQLSLMEKTELEDELEDWLEEHGVEEAYELTENLIEFGFETEDLDEILAYVPEQYFSPIIKWINDNLTTEKMVLEIEEASRRISHLVNSVKSFTYMDKDADKQEIDITEGIRNTVNILAHKLRKNNVTFKAEFPPDLPKVKAYPGELNQVWTNLFDNAIDAMEASGGSLIVGAKVEGRFMKVQITDNGTGIPEGILSQIFDPFFTTKDMGKGTGLGLDTVQKIISNHNGEVKVESKPGNTKFLVCLPI
ncbi:sensor histidine kinase [Flexithrix dorotheae]|uniref:sensor histidine kinase n=1 Tax=Flexithrix dorotheae TaxID=70993 RepID=UPI00037AF2A5|nr:ATP-binding protein [Flexithrix dorotheae]